MSRRKQSCHQVSCRRLSHSHPRTCDTDPPQAPGGRVVCPACCCGTSVADARQAPDQTGKLLMLRHPHGLSLLPPLLCTPSSPPSCAGAPILPAPPPMTTEAAADAVVVSDSLAVSKAGNADRAAPRGSACAALEISTAETVGNTPPVPAVFAEPAVARGTNEQPSGEADNAGNSTIAGDEFRQRHCVKKPQQSRPTPCWRHKTLPPRPAKKTRWRPKRWPQQPPRHPRTPYTQTMHSVRPERVGPRPGQQQRRRLRRTHLGRGYVPRHRNWHPPRRHTRPRPRPGDGVRRSKNTSRLSTTKCKIDYGVLTQGGAGRGGAPTGGSRVLPKVEHAAMYTLLCGGKYFVLRLPGELVAHPYTKLKPRGRANSPLGWGNTIPTLRIPQSRRSLD